MNIFDLLFKVVVKDINACQTFNLVYLHEVCHTTIAKMLFTLMSSIIFIRLYYLFYILIFISYFKVEQ